MTFKKSLFISLILFSTIPVIAIGLISVYLTANSLIQERTATLEALAHTNASSLNQLVEAQKRELKIMTERLAIVNYLKFAASGVEDKEQQIKLLNESVSVFDSWITSNPNYYDAILVNSEGKIISAYHPTNIGKSVKDKYYFKIASQRESAYVSDLTQTVSGAENSKVFVISQLVYTGVNGEKGVLALFISTEFLDDFIKNIQLEDTCVASLADSAGIIIAHPDKKIAGLNTKYGIPENYNAMLEYYAGKKPSEGKMFYTLDGVERVLAYSFLNEVNWMFIVRQDQDEITAPANKIYFAVAGFLLISLIIAIIASFSLANSFARPLLTLKNAFSRAAQEKQYIICNVASKNEFGQLAESYNVMISRLNENFEELTSAYEEISSQQEELSQNYEALNSEKKQNEYLAYHDSTTGVLNRPGFMKQLKAVLQKEANGGIIFIDLDDFKYVNDVWGHSHGDKVLAEFGKRLSSLELGLEFCARIGGDEFLLVKIGDEEEIKKTVQKLLDSFKTPIEVDGIITYTTGSLGISFFKEGTPHADTLIKNADIAMYKAKESGKNTYKFFSSEMRDSIDRRNKVLEVLCNAVDKNEVFMVYQPEVDINSGKILAFEALMRINSKDLGIINPNEFIPIAEASKIIIKLGYWAISETCAFAKTLLDKGIDFGVISVNISSVQLMHPEFVPNLLETVRLSKLDPKYLQIEITESVLIDSIETVIKKLTEIRKTGIKVALDDFGTGYSSLNYLINLPVDILKIDKSFKDDIYTDSKKQIICQKIIDMSHELGLKVVTEGIELEQELNLLREQGCDMYQGYLFSRPVEQKDVIPLIKKSTA